MKKLLMGTAISAVLLGSASAATLDDPLHGLCAGCADNGTNTPLNGQTTFGWSSSPPNQTGDLTIDVLIPNNDVVPSGLGVGGTAVGPLSLFSATPWTTGDLAVNYLGETGASPAQPIGAYLPTTDSLDPGATGFFVLRLDTGTQTLTGTAWPVSDQFDITGGNLPLGAYVVAELVNSNGTIETANSGALLVNTQSSETPLPASIVFMFTGLVGLIGLGHKWVVPLV